MISQIRAVTTTHPITIYLSPTSTAVINVTQIEPALTDSKRPFAILSPQAEVIVAPKVRQTLAAETDGPFDLTGTKNSVASTTKSKRARRRVVDPSVLLRTVCLPHVTFTGDVDDGLCVYVDPYLRGSAVFSGGVAKITILPSPSKPTQPTDKDKETAPNDTEMTIAKTVVVKVLEWEDAPENHVALSPRLAATLGINKLGDIAR